MRKKTEAGWGERVKKREREKNPGAKKKARGSQKAKERGNQKSIPTSWLNSSQGTPASEARTPDLLNTALLPAILINNIFRLNLISQPELKGRLAAGWRPRVPVSSS